MNLGGVRPFGVAWVVLKWRTKRGYIGPNPIGATPVSILRLDVQHSSEPQM